MNLEQVRLVDEAITSRHSVRAFLNTPIESEVIKDILQVASRAPSGTNTQPWKVYVVKGNKRDEMVERVCAAQIEVSKKTQNLQKNIKKPLPIILRNGYRRLLIAAVKMVGDSMVYSKLKKVKKKMAEQQLRNFKLFDAPVGLFFTVNKTMGIGSKMDIAMMIQNVMVAAKARGLDTCPQAAWNHFHPVVLDILGASDDEELVCAIALGHADPNHIVNTFITPREPVENFAVFLDE